MKDLSVGNHETIKEHGGLAVTDMGNTYGYEATTQKVYTASSHRIRQHRSF